MHRIRFFFLIIAAAPITLVSCNQGTIATPNSSVGFWSVPRVGARYVYSEIDTLQSGVRMQNDTMIVIATEQEISGKSNVEKLYETDARDTTYYNFESNGDLSQGLRVFNDTVSQFELQWTTIPTGTMQPINQERSLDTIAFGTEEIRRDSVYYSGTESLPLAMGNFTSIEIDEAFISDEIEQGSSGSQTDTMIEHSWYAPELGNIVRFAAHQVENGMLIQGYERHLVQYVP